MVIDKIGNINNIIEPRKSGKVQAANASKPVTDSVEISNEGLRVAEEAHLAQIVRDTPDIRVDKVNEIKARIASGEYDKMIDEKILGDVAEKLVKGIFRD